MMGAAHAGLAGSGTSDAKLTGPGVAGGFTAATTDEKGYNGGSSGLGMGPARLGGGVPDANTNALTVQKRLPKEETV